MKQPCFDGALRNLLHGSDLRQGQPLKEHQLHALALRCAQLLDALAEQLLALILLQLLHNTIGRVGKHLGELVDVLVLHRP